VAVKYFAKKPINHKGTHYRPGDEITGFTGWWRYWQYLRYARVNKVDTAAAPVITLITPTDHTLTLTVTSVEVGGDPFINFEYKLDNGSWTPFNPVDTDTPFVITGLTNGVTYAVTVRADNAAGVGATSNSVSSTPVTLPSPPTALTSTAVDTAASIAFEEGDNGGSAFTDYEYQIDDGEWISGETDVTPVQFIGLEAGTEYSVVLRAKTLIGYSTASDACVFTTADIPDAPTTLQSIRGNTTASIIFVAGADNGGTITDYEYRVGGGDWVSGATDASPVSVTGLVNGVEVTITLRAVNFVGNSPASAGVTVVPATTPGPPTGLTPTPGNTTASIAFTGGINGGALITNYEYKVDDGEWTLFSPPDVETPLVVTGLTNGVEVDIILRAINDVGPGTASDPCAVTPSL